jgi:hypothetical protein
MLLREAAGGRRPSIGLAGSPAKAGEYTPPPAAPAADVVFPSNFHSFSDFLGIYFL